MRYEVCSNYPMDASCPGKITEVTYGCGTAKESFSTLWTAVVE
jgi:hypothetical protein